MVDFKQTDPISPVSLEELVNAETQILKCAQNSCFSHELHCLKSQVLDRKGEIFSTENTTQLRQLQKTTVACSRAKDGKLAKRSRNTREATIHVHRRRLLRSIRSTTRQSKSKKIWHYFHLSNASCHSHRGGKLVRHGVVHQRASKICR